MGIGHSAAYEIVNSVCKSITSHLVSRYISTQTDEIQLQEFMEASEGKKKVPPSNWGGVPYINFSRI